MTLISVVDVTDEDVSGDEEDISDRLLRDDGVSIHAQNIRAAGPSQQNPGSHAGDTSYAKMTHEEVIPKQGAV